METKSFPRWRIDKNVIITMMAVIVSGSIIFAFRYKSPEPCEPFTILLENEHYNTGEEIRFNTNALNFQQLKWDFGDSQKSTSRTPVIWHKYERPGSYTVTLTADNRCWQNVTLHVSRARPKESPLKIKPAFIFDTVAEVGKEMSFLDTTKGASSWQWRFGETGTVDDTRRAPTYTFTKPGIARITLTINHDIEQSTLVKIFVKKAAQKSLSFKAAGGTGRIGWDGGIKEKPDTPPMNVQLFQPDDTAVTDPVTITVPPPRLVPDITGKELEGALRLVADDQTRLEYFSTYTCDELNIPVILNEETTTLKDVCSRLANLKNSGEIKKLTVSIVNRDKSTNCISVLNIICKVKRDVIGYKNL